MDSRGAQEWSADEVDQRIWPDRDHNLCDYIPNPGRCWRSFEYPNRSSDFQHASLHIGRQQGAGPHRRCWRDIHRGRRTGSWLPEQAGIDRPKVRPGPVQQRSACPFVSYRWYRPVSSGRKHPVHWKNRSSNKDPRFPRRAGRNWSNTGSTCWNWKGFGALHGGFDYR